MSATIERTEWTTERSPDEAAGPEETVIQARNLRKRRGKKVVLDGLDLSVRRGEVFGILCPEGEGKTTLLEMIAGVKEPDSGEIEVAGYDAIRERGDMEEVMKEIIGVMPHTMAFSASLTLMDVLYSFADLRGANASPERARELLGIASLTKEADLRLEELSHGQRRRFWLTLALVNSPRILLLDEPTAGLDSCERGDFWRVVRGLRCMDVTVVLAPRDAREAAELCDRVAMMSRGRILVCDTPTALIGSLEEEAIVSFRHRTRGDASRLEPNISLLPGVVGRERRGLRVRLRAVDAKATVAGLDVLASHRDLSLVGLSVDSPDLGDAFVSYAGRRPKSPVGGI